VKKFQDPQPTVTKKRPAFTPLILEQNTLLNSKQPILRINYHTGVSIDFFDAVDADYIKGLCQ
jgi:hypothetical protein